MYKDTLNLPTTDFPMRADAARREPERLARWDAAGLYAQVRAARAGAPRFVLHDGPPYANEHIHLGTAFNKILKDFVVRTRTMMGLDSPYTPGWDCHGLPIEQKVDRELGAKKLAMSDLEIRAACRGYAEKFVAIQRDEFRRMGGIGDWYAPYLTMSPRYEADIAVALGRVIEQGLLYRERKSIRWCWHDRTALAEAELEYASRRDPEITVAFPAADPAALRRLFGSSGDAPAAFAIWTTTPWTIPSNLAIAVHPDAEYVLLETARGGLVAAAALAPALLASAGLEGKTSARVPGRELVGQRYLHPLAPGWRATLPAGAKAFVVVPADYVTLDTGTGLVHTAPGHGEDDFRTGKLEGIPIVSPLDAAGKYTSEVAALEGVHVFDANPRVTAELERVGALLASREGEHEYPHCWRCKKPVIFRATEQYFIALTPDAAPHAAIDLRARSLEEIAKATWVPRWGEARIAGMVANRFEWCVSRQRRWGSPITVLVCANERCGAVWPDGSDPAATRAFFARVEALFAAEGADAWYARPTADFAPAGLACPKCGGTAWEKERDILDVWFDSGASHLAVCDNNRFPGLTWPADVYLEAHDQYRGWFQASLLVGVVTHGAAPFRSVVVHGHVLDAAGRKMSKSMGNVISPLDIANQQGADVLRLWAASVDFREDMPFSKETLTRTAEAYRKIRNTLRFLLANLDDALLGSRFDPDRDGLPLGELIPVDAHVLRRARDLAARVEKAYRDYEFHVFYHALNNFCAVDLSAVYLDFLKDRLYCSHPASPQRRSAQTVLHRLARVLGTAMAPVLCYTADELWDFLPGAHASSVHLETLDLLTDVPDDADSDALDARFRKLFDLRDEVNKELEVKRQQGEFGKSLEAALVLGGNRAALDADLAATRATLEELCIVSQVVGGEAAAESRAYPGLRFGVRRAEGTPCPRCWQVCATPSRHPQHPDLCPRCLEVVLSLEDWRAR
ncbi:MAG TPA: isoleucine--tRNA ligase [Thermoanaerobaculaceae bacterium]|nr:isoleucine--tRNA ligase [Thermoanaerobaculaceae bacterium]